MLSALVLGVLAVLVGIRSYRQGNHLASVLSTALLLRIAIITADSLLNFLPGPPIAEQHNYRAGALALAWTDGQFVNVLGDVGAMRVLVAHVLAPFYLVLGHSPISGRLGVALISLSAGYLVFRITEHIAGQRTSLQAAAIVLFWPTLIYRSVVVQREILVVVTLLAFVLMTLRWVDEVTPLTVSVSLVSIATVWVLRKENLLIIGAMIGAFTLIKRRDGSRYLIGFSLFALPLVLYFFLNFGQFTGYGSALTPDTLDSYAHGRAHGDAAYLTSLHYDSWIDVVLYAPVKVVYFLYTPFPWQVQDTASSLAGVSAFALLAVTMAVRRGIAKLQRSPQHLALLLTYLVVGVVGYSLVEMNYGAAVRRRILFVPILLILATIGLSNIRVRVRHQEQSGKSFETSD
jgi:predicted membrane-bound mannosyltransferase